MARFKESPGFVIVCAPGKPTENLRVDVVIYAAAGRVGIKIKEGELRGYVVFLDEAAIAHAKKVGKDTDELRVG